MTTAGLAVALFALILVPATSFADVALNIAFDPAQACPGDDVSFFFSLENVGADAEQVELSVMIDFNGTSFGPVVGTLELAAGEVVSDEVALVVPPLTAPGALTIDATATDSGGSVNDTASLTINDCGGSGTQTVGLAARVAFAVRKAMGHVQKERF